MKTKLIVLAVLVCGLWSVHVPISLQTHAGAAAEIPLLPLRIGEFQRTASMWKLKHSSNTSEEGAMYVLPSSATSIPVQLDFFRFSNKPHNGLICYLGQGERLNWLQKKILNASTHPVNVLLAMTESENQLRLVATTECYADHCAEENIQSRLGFSLPDFAPLKMLHKGSVFAPHGVVPLSIVMKADIHGDNRDQLEREMRTQMTAFLDVFDFSQVQRQAAIQ